MVDHQHQHVGVRSGAGQGGTHQGTGGQIERPAGLRGGPLRHLVGGQFTDRQRPGRWRRVDHLPRQAVLGHEPGPQRLVAYHQRVQRLGQRVHPQVAAQPQHERDVVQRRAGVELLGEPDRLLLVGARQRPLPRHRHQRRAGRLRPLAGSPLLGQLPLQFGPFGDLPLQLGDLVIQRVGRRGSGQRPGQFAYARVGRQHADRGAFEPADRPYRAERVTAQVKEADGHVDLVEVEHLPVHRRDGLLLRRGRQHRLGGGSGGGGRHRGGERGRHGHRRAGGGDHRLDPVGVDDHGQDVTQPAERVVGEVGREPVAVDHQLQLRDRFWSDHKRQRHTHLVVQGVGTHRQQVADLASFDRQ